MIAPGFNGYLSLKKEYNFSRRGVQFNHVLAVQFIQVAYKRVNLDGKKLKQTAKLLYKTLDVSSLKQAFANYKIVSTYIHERKDYSQLLDSYFENVPDYHRVHLPAMPYKTQLSLSNIVAAFNFVFFRKPQNVAVKEKIYIACYFIHYLNILDSLTKEFNGVELGGKKYVPFNSSFDLETLLTQFFRLKDADTYHISHGLSYVSYNDLTGFDAVNGENITAENILVWGETSRNGLINNYAANPGAITVAGNPKYPRTAINTSTTFKKGIVFLGAKIYSANNAKLMELIAGIGAIHHIQFAVKAHPSSNTEILAGMASKLNLVFLPYDSSITEILKAGEYDFSVVYNSTVYYEAMYYSLPCLRYAVDENGDFDGLDDKFYDEASFFEKVKAFKNTPIKNLNSKIEQLLVDNLGMGINMYGSIFNN